MDAQHLPDKNEDAPSPSLCREHFRLFIIILVSAFISITAIIITLILLCLPRTHSSSSSPVSEADGMPTETTNDIEIISCATALEFGGRVHLSWTETVVDDNSSEIIILGDDVELDRIKLGIAHYTVDRSYTTFQLRLQTQSHVQTIFLTAASCEIPTLIMDTANAEKILDKAKKIPITFEIIDDQNSSNSFHVTDTTTTIKGRGNTSWSMFPKKGYSIKFKSRVSLLGMPPCKKWALIACYRDKSLMRNNYAAYMAREIFNTIWTPSYTFVNCILNGDYIGVYVLAETIIIDKNRVNIPDIMDTITEDRNSDGRVDLYDGGFIMEVDQWLDADYCFLSSMGVPLCLKRPDTASDTINSHVQTIMQKFEDILYSDAYLNEDRGYASMINMNSLVDWYIVMELTKNYDASFQSSVFIYYNPYDCQLYFGPIWDFDASLGCFSLGGVDDPEGFWVNKKHPDRECNWITRIFEDPAFRAAVKARMIGARETLEGSVAFLRRTASKLHTAADLNFKRWPILGKTENMLSPAGYEFRTTYESEVEYLVEWITQRIAWFYNELSKEWSPT